MSTTLRPCSFWLYWEEPCWDSRKISQGRIILCMVGHWKTRRRCWGTKATRKGRIDRRIEVVPFISLFFFVAAPLGG